MGSRPGGRCKRWPARAKYATASARRQQDACDIRERVPWRRSFSRQRPRPSTCSIDMSSAYAVEVIEIASPADEIIKLAGRDLGADIGRDLGDDVGVRIRAFEHAVDQSIGAEILDAGHSER